MTPSSSNSVVDNAQSSDLSGTSVTDALLGLIFMTLLVIIALLLRRNESL